MTRFILSGLTAAIAVAVLSGTGCQSTGVGDPCVPEQEYDPAFLGFVKEEVSVESKSFQCESRLCLVNHFQGRVTCPYGQKPTATGATPGDGSNNYPPAKSCITPADQPVTGQANGAFLDPVAKDEVKANCSGRQAKNAVYCSCRCANVNGQTNDGANYCTCPDGFSCAQLVSAVSSTNAGLTGAYCIKSGTAYDVAQACTPLCDPTQATSASGCGKDYQF